MAVALNHTIVRVRDKKAAAHWYADMLGLPTPVSFGPFQMIELAHGLSLDFADDEGPGQSQHYAFLVSEAEFDEILARITGAGLDYFADPGAEQRGHNTNNGGRGLYWADPDGHWLEIITRPYGSGTYKVVPM